MALKPDFQNALQYYVYTNLPVLMNPFNARNVVVTNAIIPTPPTTPTTPITSTLIAAVPTTLITNTSITSSTSTSTTPIISSTSISPVITITPEVLQALQAYTLNNFPDIGLPTDIQGIAKNFFANIPPLILVTPTTAVPVTTAVTVAVTPTAPNINFATASTVNATAS